MSSPTATAAPSRDELLAASQRRAQASLSEDQAEELRFDKERDTRQTFRRLLDPGILRGVEKKTAMASIKTLLTISENLLSQPDNDKFKQFKPTNTLIKKTLVDVKGALEYAVEMGFRADVQNFQPYYVFNPRKTTELRIGAAVLREALDRESEKEERTSRAKAQEKGALSLQAQQVKLAFEDDRKRKAMQDKLDKERRQAREAAAAVPTSPSSMEPDFPGGIPLQGGRTLSSPPPYQDEEDSASE